MISSFKPPRRTILEPGPSDVSQRVSEAMAKPTIGRLDPYSVGMMDEIKSRYIWLCFNRYVAVEIRFRVN